MNNQCRIHAVVTASLFCQLLREPEEIQNHGLHAARQPDVKEIREMLLSVYDRTWTFGLCSLWIFCNMVAVKSLNTNKKKESFFVSDDKVFQKHYQFEDFFWTGSGDGPVTEELFANNTDPGINVVEATPSETWRTTTVFHTTTILFATVYSNSEGCVKFGGCKPEISAVQTGSIDYSLPTFPHSKVPDILPSPTRTIPQTNTLRLPEEEGVGMDASAFGEPPTSLATPIPPSSAKPTIFTETGAKESAFPKTDLEAFNLTTTTVFPTTQVDQKYWLTTILRNDNYSPTIELNSTENKLSTLYRKAFNRRHQKYGPGIDRNTVVEPVKVHILNVSCEGNSMEIIYSVTLGGKPVPAISAANDMRLLTASEVIAELGHPILTKAEPYMKGVIPLGARVRGRTRDTWLFIGSVIAAVLLLIILAGLFALGLSKKRTKRSAAKGISNRKKVFEEEAGSSNLGFEEEADSKTKSSSTRKAQSRSGDSKFLGESTGTTVKFTEEERRGSTTSSSCSGSSEASLVRLRYQQKRKEKRKGEMEEVPKPKPRTRMRRIESYDCSKNLKRHGYIQSTGSAVSKNTFEEITTEGYDDMDYSPRLTKSPTSYLSMPSVRAFPRGTNIPEPLNKILEPTSIRHLDADSDSPNELPHSVRERHQEVDVEQVCEVKNKFIRKKVLTRHASLEGDDPGFIGPVVWNRHCQKINERATGTLNIEVVDENVNVGRMRKRFNELLDDALSMFGSRNGSPEGSDVVPARQLDHRVHSAIVRPAGVAAEEAAFNRPKTTGSKRPQSSVISGPRGAWETPSCSTLARPVSAGAFRQSSPLIDKNLIYVNSDLPPGDPAIPLIAAIKNELKKFEDPTGNNP